MKLDEVNKNYLKNLNSSEQKLMKAEIKKFKGIDYRDSKAYPDDWDADIKYKARGGKTKESKHTLKFKEFFLSKLKEDELLESNVDTALQNKAEQSGESLKIIRAVYNRGLAAWKTGHRPGVAQHQWAMARVNSFLTGGKAREIDKDLLN